MVRSKHTEGESEEEEMTVERAVTILNELILHGIRFKGFTVQEAKEALIFAVKAIQEANQNENK